MLHISSNNNSKNDFIKKTSFTFFVNLFKRKKAKSNVTSARSCQSAMEQYSECKSEIPRIPSALSVGAVDFSTYSPPSPALSAVTLTPGRTRDIDQDMAALRLSRQDNPFLQVLASRESLVESLEESESDDANLMAQEFPRDLDVDPLSLPEIHEHMIRSPPPVTWPKSPNFKVFKFPMQNSDDESSQESLHKCGKKTPSKVLSPKHSKTSFDESLSNLSSEAITTTQTSVQANLATSARPCQKCSYDTKDRSSNPFLLLNPEVRRLHIRTSDDNVHLVSKCDDYEQNVELNISSKLTSRLSKRPV